MGAPAGNAADFRFDTELAQELERVAQPVRHALEHGTRERAPIVAERQADEGTACVRVGVGRALALQVRLEEKALRPRLPALRLGEQILVRRPAERLVQPLQRACGREHHAHRVPHSGEGVAEDVQPRFGVGPVFGQRGEDDAGGAEDDRERAGTVDADTQRSCSLVARCTDRRALVGGRQPLGLKLERLQHLVAPAAATSKGVPDIPDRSPSPVGGAGRVPSRMCSRAGLGLVISQPDSFSAVSRSAPVRRSINHSSPTRSSISPRISRALVVPEDRGRRPVALVERTRVIWPEKPIDAGSTSRSARAASVARHQSSGSCSAQPGLGIESGYSRSARPTISPSGVSASALTPLVPTSIPTSAVTPREALSARRGSRTGRGT